MDALPQRPAPPRSPVELVRAWLGWFGVARVAAGAVAVVAVAAGAFWLLRPPPTAVESTLPFASSAITASAETPVTSATTLTNPASSSIVVYIAGAVLVPGVFDLPAGTRVHHALDAAGGLTAEADLGALNLAAPLRDGDRVYVPRAGESVPPLVGAPINAEAAPTAPINLNTATVSELDQLPGVGPSTAAAIVAHRDETGPFATIDALLDVPGIGPAKLAAIRDLITV